MSDYSSAILTTDATPSTAEHLGREIALLSARLARMLSGTAVASESAVAAGIAFLRAFAQLATGGPSLADQVAMGTADPSNPIGRLATAYSFAPAEVDLLLLAGMADEHEGFASLFRTLHPRGEPRPTIGLAAQLICDSAHERWALRELLTTGAAVRSGAIVLSDDGPFFERPLLVADALWPALAGVNAWPSFVRSIEAREAPRVYGDWLATKRVMHAKALLRRGEPALLLITADGHTSAVHRAAALAAS